MSRIFSIFMIGMGGVFLSMTLLYGAARFNALLTDLISGGRENAAGEHGDKHKKSAGKEGKK